MKRMTSLLFGVAMVAGIVAALAQISTGTDVKSAPQSARDIRGASPYLEIEKEPAPTCRGRLLGTVPSRERAYFTRVRGRCPQGITTYRASAHNRRRLALVVGGCQRQQHGRHSRAAARPTQGEDRVG